MSMELTDKVLHSAVEKLEPRHKAEHEVEYYDGE